jgi:hypothetical protein
MMHLAKIIFILVLILPTSSIAEIIFYEDYDNIPSGWNCSQPIPPRWTGQATCTYDAYGVGHYCGEVSSGGRKGNSLKLWRRNGGTTDYCGYLNNTLSAEEFNKHHKELFIRFYMRIPLGWDATLGSGATHKLNRLGTGTKYGSPTSVLYFDVKGPNFKNGRFSFYVVKEGPVRYTSKTLTELGIVDGQLHCYEIHFKMNSASGVADGELHFYIDGKEISIFTPYGPVHPRGLSKWDFRYSADEYIATLLTPAIGNVSEVWSFPTGDWYAVEFDDFVVSTTYVGP